MKIQYLGHASLAIEANGKHIIVDPFITPNELAKNIDFESLKADYIVITHAHQDHVYDVEEQAKQFTAATEVSALAVTKLDGTAKGGVVIGISDQFQVPVKYIGVGEKMEDLQIFNGMEFVDSFFKQRN